MRVQSRWKATVGLPVENLERRLDPSPGNCYVWEAKHVTNRPTCRLYHSLSPCTFSSRPLCSRHYSCMFTVLSDRPKHPTKVHVWAGISKREKTGICIFEGIMNAELSLDNTLLPFVEQVYPEGYKLCKTMIRSTRVT